MIINFLPTGSIDRACLGDYLVEIAISGRNQSSRAVYHAILALASYHRGNNMVEADRLKSLALNDLLAQEQPDVQDGIAHISANLLLCVVEVRIMRQWEYTVLTQHRCNKFCQAMLAGSIMFAARETSLMQRMIWTQLQEVSHHSCWVGCIFST